MLYTTEKLVKSVFVLLLSLNVVFCSCASYTLSVEYPYDGTYGWISSSLWNNKGESWSSKVGTAKCTDGFTKLTREGVGYEFYSYPCNLGRLTLSIPSKKMSITFEKASLQKKNHNGLRPVNEYWFAWDDQAYKFC